MSELFKSFTSRFWEVCIFRALLALLLWWNLFFSLGSFCTSRRLPLLLVRSLHSVRKNRRGLVVSTANCQRLRRDRVILNFANLSECSQASSSWHRWLLFKDLIHFLFIQWNQRFSPYIRNLLGCREYCLAFFLLWKQGAIEAIIFDCDHQVSFAVSRHYTARLILALLFDAKLGRRPCRAIFDYHLYKKKLVDAFWLCAYLRKTACSWFSSSDSGSALRS